MTDFIAETVIFPVLEPADVDHHVDLVGAVGNGVLRLKHLDRRGIVAVGKTDHRADRHPVPQIFLRPSHVGRRDTHAGRPVRQGVVADSANLLPGGRLGQQSVVHPSVYLISLHRFLPPSIHFVWLTLLFSFILIPVCPNVKRSSLRCFFMPLPGRAAKCRYPPGNRRRSGCSCSCISGTFPNYGHFLGAQKLLYNRNRQAASQSHWRIV